MKKQSATYTLCFSLLVFNLFIAPVITWCCGPSLMADEARFALFRNGLDNNVGLQPFYYSENIFNLTGADYRNTDLDRNCREWQNFTGKNTKFNDVYKVQYETPGNVFVEAYRNNRWDSFPSNTFIKWLLQKKNAQALQYMLLAKKAEALQKSDLDPWDTTLTERLVTLEALAANAVAALQQPLPVFLKERYAFQAIKNYYYSGKSTGDFNPALFWLYKRYLKDGTSIVSGWVNVYYALANPDPKQRTFYLLKTFDECDEKKLFVYTQVSTEDLDTLEQSITDTKTLALINTVRALKEKGRALKSIRAVVKYDQGSKYLPLLITREVNKMENWIWSAELLGFRDNMRSEDDYEHSEAEPLIPSAQEKDRVYLAQLTSYLEALTARQPANTNQYQKLALIHLYNIGKRYEKAYTALGAVKPFTNKRYETQRLIEVVLTLAKYRDITRSSTQAEIAKAVQKLLKMNPRFKSQLNKLNYSIWDHESDNEINDDVSELYVYLSRCFKAKGDIVTAGLLYTNANVTADVYDGYINPDGTGYGSIAFFDRYATVSDIDKLIAFKHRKGKTAFQQLLVPPLWALDDQYKDLKGTILMRDRKFGEALTVFKSMNQAFWSSHDNYADNLPTTSITHTGLMIPSETTLPENYTSVSKTLIVQDIVNLIKGIAAAKNYETKARLTYKLANTYYNIGYNGKGWMMISYGKTSNEPDTSGSSWAWYGYSPRKHIYAEDYYDCKSAIRAYKQALSLTTNKELAAKCLLALSVCDTEEHKGYLQTLQDRYKNTMAFLEAAAHCPDVKDYVSDDK